jgi:uncharacterized protein YaiI (UPF0178 family)
MAVKILVDADACPRSVLQICINTGHKYDLPVWTVASFNHNIESDHHIVVGNASQETDLKIMNLCTGGDIVVTQDWGLAAIVMSKGAQALSPTGRIYKVEMMDFMLEEREIKAKLRRSGGRTKGPKKRTTDDDTYFEYNLIKCLQSILS